MALSFPMASPPKRQKLGARDIPSRWRELQGSGSWKGLLDPLDSDLRASLIAYGELAEATYDVFNKDAKSLEAQCMYSCAGLLAASGVSHPEYYTVTKFLYATCDLLDSSSSVAEAMFVQPMTELREGEEEESVWAYTNWIGYVAVATDVGVAKLGRRDIVVAWRGTVNKVEYAKDAETWYTTAATVLGPSAGDFKKAKVHHGFLSMYTAPPRLTENHQVCPGQTDISTSARDQALAEVRRLMEVYKDEETSITVTGHSLGGALATLNAVDIVAHRVNMPPEASSKQQPCPVTAFLFASPRIGNADFKLAFASFPELWALGVINENDLVPTLPKIPPGYMHATTATLPIDTDRSPYLRSGTIKIRHNLECYLHGLAGDHGPHREFKLEVKRDVVLVNKGTNALKDGYPVPAQWWNANYKGTMKGVVGRWKLESVKDE